MLNTFVPEGEPSHLGELFERLQANHSRGLQPGNGHLVLLDEPAGVTIASSRGDIICTIMYSTIHAVHHSRLAILNAQYSTNAS